jgi:hypothetical protein
VTDIDTAAIRAYINVDPSLGLPSQVLALCDALDGARAELAEVREERNWLIRDDTAAIRAAHWNTDRDLGDVVLDLCDALDAARADAADGWRQANREHNDLMAARAELREWKTRSDPTLTGGTE